MQIFIFIKIRRTSNSQNVIYNRVAKSLMRNGKPVIIALSTNDGLGLNLKNIGSLMTNQNIYFVPFGQDDLLKKPCSLVADLTLAPETIAMALEHLQIQPLIIQYGS